MKLRDVPASPAYLVSHDPYMNGAMDVWPWESLASAQAEATTRNERAESMGYDPTWRAYAKLPRVRVWKYHTPIVAKEGNA